MKEILLKFKTEDEFNGFRFMLDSGFCKLTEMFDEQKDYSSSLGVRKRYADIWQQIEGQIKKK